MLKSVYVKFRKRNTLPFHGVGVPSILEDGKMVKKITAINETSCPLK